MFKSLGSGALLCKRFVGQVQVQVNGVNGRSNKQFFNSFSSVAEVLAPNEVRIPIDADRVSPQIINVISKDTANQKQITQMRISHQIKKLQVHKGDTGSSSVQIGVMTEKILNAARHFAQHNKDKGSLRGFQILVQRRRKMMRYLKRSDFVQYQKTIKELNLYKEDRQVRV